MGLVLAVSPGLNAQERPNDRGSLSQNARVASADERAAETESRMTVEESTLLTHGILALPFMGVTPDVTPLGAGFVAGVPRLGVPALHESDAGLGVSWARGKRGLEGATPLPSSLATAASWDPDLARLGGAMIGAEARDKGFNVLLAGGVNLMRDPRSGRTFEYHSEDPLLSGVLAGEAIAGIQSNHIISTVKHFALNDQETGRNVIDVHIAEGPARESDLLAFQIAIERGNPGAVMCSYNRVNGPYACDSEWLLTKVLKRDWRFRGFVMSDWDAVPGVSAAWHGLDQESGVLAGKEAHLDKPLSAAAARDPVKAARLRDMNRRILWAIYANGLDRYPVTPGHVDVAAGLEVAERVAREGSVLLRNQSNTLPLAASAKRIAVIGGYADTGVLAGGGSSEVQLDGGPAASVPVGGEGILAEIFRQNYQASVPLKAIRARARGAEVTFARGDYLEEAVRAAREADVAIVFATEWRTEGLDVPSLSLPGGQDQLIAAVSAANPRTIVVLETGGPVLMPWLDQTAAVLEAWYPGGRGAEAISAILFGDANPSGRLPISFPRSVEDLPRARLDGWGRTLPAAFSTVDAPVSVNYDIEGSDVGYRWFARTRRATLFPFGFGLSYARFERGQLATDGRTASLTIRNVGKRAGADVGQVYLVSAAGRPTLRLVGFKKLSLKPGASRRVTMSIDQRLVASWTQDGWHMDAGTYSFAIGADAEHLGSPVSVKMPSRHWRD